MFITSPSDINYIPKRIISLVPSQTELLSYLELDTETIGITKFCVHPEEWFRTKTRIGGTKNININKITELNPDLIIANKEENVKEQIDLLAEKFPVYVSDIKTVADALLMLMEIGIITNKKEASDDLINKIQQQFNSIDPFEIKPLTAIYLIWKEPYMTVGGDTFIADMMEKGGFENIYKHLSRYPEITLEEMQSHQPDIILLSSEPYPFRQKNIDEIRRYFPSTKILIADGEMFSWYGHRMLYAPEYFRKLHQQISSI